jgi:nucleotide-binding universal stress UspA family protein
MSALTERPVLDARTVFSRVLVGVDGSAPSFEAARQAALFAEGDLTLLAAYDTASAVVGGSFGVPAYYDDTPQRLAAESVLAQARERLERPALPAKTAQCPAWDALLREANTVGDTLIAVGSHGAGRLMGVVLGSVATEVIHKARCSVLIARASGNDVPRRIVVGVDGSPESADAYAVAAHLAGRFDAELWPVVAHGGKPVDGALVDRIVERREDLPDHPVTALVAASADADLVVVGSRGLHGLPSLGSVSERVAHRARASVLVVR